MKARIVLILFFICLSSQAQTIHVSIGRLTTPLLGPLLRNFAGDQMQQLAQIAETEVKGKKKGMKYKATLYNLNLKGLFRNSSGDRYTVAVGSNGVIVVDCEMPNAEISGMLELKAKQENAGGIFGAFDPLGIVDEVAGEMTKLNREYRVTGRGIRFKAVIHVDVDGDGITVRRSEINEVKVDEKNLELRSGRDGMVATIANVLSFGSIDNMVESMILDQMRGTKVAERMAGPINDLIANGLRIPITHSLDVSPEVTLGNGRSLNDNEMRVIVPLEFVEKFAENLNQQEVFSYSGEKWGIKFGIAANGPIRATPGENNEIVWYVPVEVTATSNLFSKSASVQAVVAVRVRPHVDEERGLALNIVGTRIVDIKNWPLPFGRVSAARILSATIGNRMKESFPTEEMIATNMPVMENIDWNVNKVEVREGGVLITGALTSNNEPVTTRTQTNVVPFVNARACRTTFLEPTANGRVYIYKRGRK